MMKAAKILGHRVGGLCLAENLLEMRLHELTKVRQHNAFAFAVKQRPAQLLLQLLDGTG
jgi:hypothetical protein